MQNRSNAYRFESRRGNSAVKILIVILAVCMVTVMVCCGSGYFMMMRFAEKIGKEFEEAAIEAGREQVNMQHEEAVEQVEDSFLQEDEKKEALKQLDRMKTVFLREIDEKKFIGQDWSFETVTAHRGLLYSRIRIIKNALLLASGLSDQEKEDGKAVLASMECLLAEDRLDADDEYRIRQAVDNYMALTLGGSVPSEEDNELESDVIQEDEGQDESDDSVEEDVPQEESGEQSQPVEDEPVEDGSDENDEQSEPNEQEEGESSAPEMSETVDSPDERLRGLLIIFREWTDLETNNTPGEPCEIDIISEIRTDVDDFLRNR